MKKKLISIISLSLYFIYIMLMMAAATVDD